LIDCFKNCLVDFLHKIFGSFDLEAGDYVL